MDKIKTHTGRYVCPTNLKEGDVVIEDVAYALSSLCRFTGHCEPAYSVAQHSMSVALAVGEMIMADQVTFGQEAAALTLQALLHDSGEAYTGDASSPLKELIPELRAADKRALAVCLETFGCSPKLHPYVVLADKLALWVELDALMDDAGPAGNFPRYNDVFKYANKLTDNSEKDTPGLDRAIEGLIGDMHSLRSFGDTRERVLADFLMMFHSMDAIRTDKSVPPTANAIWKRKVV